MLEKLEPKDWLELNAKLQKKKSALRKDLSERGVLKREGNNTYDKYRYFSEAQYKELFTELLSKHGLELNFNEVEYVTFSVEGKQPNGRMPKIEFYLYDIDTGFYETTKITGEGIDKGDKAGYKAYTGALKYYLADKFMVATGDDPETESPDGRSGRPQIRSQQRPQNVPQQNDPKIGQEQLNMLRGFADQVGISAETICQTFKVESLPELTMSQWTRATQLLEKEAERKGVKWNG